MTESPELSVPTEVSEEPAVDSIPLMPKRRPVRRPSKPDAVLAAAVDAARSGVLEVADESEVGEHQGVSPDAERLVTHRFQAFVPGYVGWHWYATLARLPRGKDATVCEVGLLPSEDSLLAPAWVPWSERVRPEDSEGSDDGTADTAQADVALVDTVVLSAADDLVAPLEDHTDPSIPGGEPPVA